MNVTEPTLYLDRTELAGTIEGLRGSLGRRLLIAHTDHVIRSSPIEDFQVSVRSIGRAYQKAMMLGRNEGLDAPDLLIVRDMMIDDEIWDLYDQFISAADWENVPILGNYPWVWRTNLRTSGDNARRLLEELATIL